MEEFFSTFHFVGKVRRCRFQDEEKDTVYVFQKGDCYYLGTKKGGLVPVRKDRYEIMKEEIRERLKNGPISIGELHLGDSGGNYLYWGFIIGLALKEWTITGWGRKRIVKLIK